MQLGDRHGFVELGDRTEHLAHQLGRGRVVNQGAGIVCHDKVDAPAFDVLAARYRSTDRPTVVSRIFRTFGWLSGARPWLTR